MSLSHDSLDEGLRGARSLESKQPEVFREAASLLAGGLRFSLLPVLLPLSLSLCFSVGPAPLLITSLNFFTQLHSSSVLFPPTS